ncbi:MAG: hypothetical protein Q8M83_04230, partial [bacterium]|nr:hypothetical protein [bacterium]
RLQTRSWTAQDGTQKQTTEIVISDMILLDSRREGVQEHAEESSATESSEEAPVSKKSSKAKEEEAPKEPQDEEIAPDDIPF